MKNERKIFNFKSVVDVDLTINTFGYHPDDIGRTSPKKVIAVCRFCGKPMAVNKGNFMKQGSACHRNPCAMVEIKHFAPYNDPEKQKESIKIVENIYGNTSPSKNAIIAQKISDSLKTLEVRQKIEKTNLEKYGHKNVSNNKEIIEKIKAHDGIGLRSKTAQEQYKQTNIERYNVENPQQNPEIRQKTLESFARKIAANPDKYKIANVLKGTGFWLDLPTMSLTDICLKYDIPYQSTASILSRPAYLERFRNTYTYPRQQSQRAVAKEIAAMGLNVILNDKSVIGKELDILIPSKNYAIEYNGSYWHSEACLKTTVAAKKHIEKTLLCRNKNIRLFHLFEKDWQTRPNQVLTFLRSALGQNQILVDARKCELAEDLGPDLVENNHIQGASSRVIKTFDLTYNGEWIASMHAAHHHRNNNTSDLVLSRLAFNDNTTIRGGASKLFCAMKKWAQNNGYNNIISWSDTAWTEGAIYKTLGFEMVKEWPPGYFYWDMKNNKYVSAQSQQKKMVKCPDTLKEHEWAKQRGLYRIWDCGKKKWALKVLNPGTL